MKDLKSNSNPDIKIFLIGNKVDLEESRLVTKEQALQFQKDFELDLFMETSAKNGFNNLIIHEWGLGIGDWGMGIGDLAQSLIPLLE